MNIIISGAGIAGLSAAIVLERLGHTVTIYEKKQKNINNGAGICLPANAVNALKLLGVHKSLIKKAHTINSWTFYSDRNKKITRILKNDLFNLNHEFIAVHRQDLYDVLAKALNATNINFNTKVEDFYSFNNKVIVNVNSQELDCDLFIGADGVNSSTRKKLLEFSDAQEVGAACWRTIIQKPNSITDPIFIIGNGRYLLLQPINREQLYIGAVCNYYLQGKKVAHSDFRTIFQDLKIDEIRLMDLIGSEDFLHFCYIQTQTEICWGIRNVLLLGDASHACAPTLQQGGSQALEDAVKLKDFFEDSILNDNAIEQYKQSRYRRVSWVLQTSNESIRMMCKKLNNSELQKRNDLISEKGPVSFQLWQELFDMN